MDYKSEFAKRLIALREQNNITQQQLAEKLNISRQSLSLYEKAERTINIELLAQIADIFSVSTDYLLGRSDTASMNEDLQTACNVTGLSENSIKMLSKFKNAEQHKTSKRNATFLCPRIEIADCLISDFQFWSICYDISCILNCKRLTVESIQETKEKMRIYVNEEKRLNKNFSEHADLGVCNYIKAIENDEKWFKVKKWEFFKHLENFSNEIIDKFEEFIIEEAESNGKHISEEE